MVVREATVPSGRVSTSEALTASCPSRNTVARIGTTSPTTAFVAQRPFSTVGATSTTGMRPIGTGGVGSGTG